MKTRLSLLLSIFLFVFIAGCGSSSSDNEPTIPISSSSEGLAVKDIDIYYSPGQAYGRADFYVLLTYPKDKEAPTFGGANSGCSLFNNKLKFKPNSFVVNEDVEIEVDEDKLVSHNASYKDGERTPYVYYRGYHDLNGFALGSDNNDLFVDLSNYERIENNDEHSTYYYIVPQALLCADDKGNNYNIDVKLIIHFGIAI